MKNKNSNRKIIQINAAASSAIKKLETIHDLVKNGWVSDDEEFQQRALTISLSCEYTIYELHSICDLGEILLNQPPAYRASPNDRQNRLVEVDVLCGRAVDFAEDMRKDITSLKNDAMNEPGTRLPEAEERGYGATAEVTRMALLSEELVVAETESDGVVTPPEELAVAETEGDLVGTPPED